MAKKKSARRAKAPIKSANRVTGRFNFGFSVASAKEAEAVQKKADRLTDGNISRLIREAVTSYKG